MQNFFVNCLSLPMVKGGDHPRFCDRHWPTCVFLKAGCLMFTLPYGLLVILRILVTLFSNSMSDSWLWWRRLSQTNRLVIKRNWSEWQQQWYREVLLHPLESISLSYDFILHVGRPDIMALTTHDCSPTRRLISCCYWVPLPRDVD